MTIHFQCENPACLKSLRARDEFAGRLTRCPRCARRLRVPALGNPAFPAVQSLPRTAPPPPDFPPVPAPQPITPELPSEERPRGGKGWLWAGIGGSALGLALLVGVVVWALTGVTPRRTPGAGGTPDKGEKTAEIPAVALGPGEVREALARGLKVTGTLTPEHVTDGFGPNTQHYHRWNADVRLDNRSGVSVALGSDLFLIETSGDAASYEGFAVFLRGGSAVVSPATYGLENNNEVGGSRINRGGGSVRFSFAPVPGETFGTAPAGGSWTLKRDFPQFSWLREEVRSSVYLVLPEVRVRSSGGVERFRVLAYFTKQPGQTWAVREQRLVRLEPGELKKMLADPGSALVVKVLAANWLAERYPAEAPPALVTAAAPLREGQLLASCLTLLTNVKGAGLEAHAVGLLADRMLPNGIRARAAAYLGAVKHGPALKQLLAASADPDEAVARGAMQGLASFGGPQALEGLAGVLRDPNRSRHHYTAASALARTRDPAALRIVQDAAADNEVALQALAAAGVPETFDFFAGLADKVKDPRRRDEVARGLKASGGDKALPILLRMLEQAEPEDKGGYGGLVSVLVSMDKPEATPKLAELAAAGNLRAVRVLAGCKNPSVQAPLTELATKASGAVRREALHGLANHWAAASVEVFAAALKSPDPQTVSAAVNGLATGKSPRATELLLPVLEHADQNVRRSAAWTLEGLDTAAQAPRLAEVLLRSRDGTVIGVCARRLVAAKWKDRSAIPKLAEKLRAARDHERHDLVKLLRQLSGNAMGPANDTEWYRDPAGWTKRWVEWAARQ